MKYKQLIHYFIGVVFLSAGIYKIINQKLMLKEVSINNLSLQTGYFFAILETAFGLMIITNFKKKLAFIGLYFGLILYLGIILYSDMHLFVSNFKDIFIFNPTIEDLMLHAIYLVVILLIVKNQIKAN
jgi:uncharacterized membrane protein YphA (DoxX/SURF4 family)